MRNEAFRKERVERVFRSVSVEYFYAYVNDRMNPTNELGPLGDGQLIISDFANTEMFHNFPI